MAVEIGANGLKEVNLTIPQSTSLTFTVTHKDADGDVIDHSGDTFDMCFQSKDRSTFVDLDSCVYGGSETITVSIPASATAELPVGKMNWDLFVTMPSERLRLCYGTVRIVDTYALDE